MSNDTKSNAPRAFEVHGTLNMGLKPQTEKNKARELDIRSLGSTVTDEELRAVGMTDDDIESLLTAGTISDPDAPTRPSLAPIYAAHAFAARLAKHAGLLRVRGADHTFEGKTYTGIAAFRDGVSLDRLEAALRKTIDNKGN